MKLLFKKLQALKRYPLERYAGILWSATPVPIGALRPVPFPAIWVVPFERYYQLKTGARLATTYNAPNFSRYLKINYIVMKCFFSILNGDMNTSVIRTVKGKTIMLQHDVTSPRPYSRIHMISGTKGFAQKYPVTGIALEPDAHRFLPPDKLDSLLRLYEHPIVREVGQKAREVGGHGGMDFIMDYRLVYCLRNGLPLDMDVYDAAEWSSIIEFSRTSVANEGRPVAIPDFTRGAWNRLSKVTYY